jgi:TatD DNase family protein
MSSFIDTHCHIDTILEKTGGTAEAVFEQMKPAPEAIVHVACDAKDLKWGKELLLKKEINGIKIYGAFGVHPLHVNNFSEQAEAETLECLKQPNAVAIGEIGLDYHYPGYNADLQKKVFLRQLETGLKTGKPFVFHIRDAENDAFEILKQIDSETFKAHIHCYTGAPDFAKKVLSLKGTYFFGVTGALTYNKTETIRESVRVIPLNRLLLETDAPYLTPVPFRGKTHSLPSMIPYTAQVLADVRGITLEELFKACRENTRAMYGI